MSIADNYTPVVEQGNGVTTVFTGPWNPVVVGYLRVYLEEIATGIQTLQVLGVDYSAATVSTGGFRVTFFTAPSALYNVVIARLTAQDQTVPYRTSKGFDGANVEQSYDKLTAMVQELQDESNRALKFPLGSTAIGQIIGIPTDQTVLMFSGTGGDVTTGPSLTEIMNAAQEAINAAASAAAAANSALQADMFANEADQDAERAMLWAIGSIGAQPAGSAKYWAEQAQLVAQTGDYVTFGPAALTLNQATGADYITLPVDPKIAARVTLNLGGVMQIAGTDFALDADPNTNRLRIVGGTSALAGVVYSGVVQLPSSLTNINAPSAGSVTTTTIENGAVTVEKLAAAVLGALVPLGAGIPYAGDADIGDYLLIADGRAVSRTDYAAFFTAFGTRFGAGNGSTTFNIPKANGMFMRFVNNGAGVDPDAGTRTAMATGGATGDTVGSVQQDALQNHQHSMGADSIYNSGSQVRVIAHTSENTAYDGGSSRFTSLAGGTGVKVATETRPKNFNMNLLIRMK